MSTRDVIDEPTRRMMKHREKAHYDPNAKAAREALRIATKQKARLAAITIGNALLNQKR